MRFERVTDWARRFSAWGLDVEGGQKTVRRFWREKVGGLRRRQMPAVLKPRRLASCATGLAAMTALLAATAVPLFGAEAKDAVGEIRELRQQIQALQAAHEARLREMERKLEAFEKKSDQPKKGEESAPSLEKILGEVGAPSRPAAAEPKPAADGRPPTDTAERIAREVGQYEGAKLPWFRGLSNPSIGVVGDVLGSFSSEKEAYDRQNRIDLRELEVLAYGPIDPFGQVTALISGADEVRVEEAALTLTALPHDLQLKGGRFFANVSRLNKTHTHDLPFVEQPLTMQNFLGSLEPLGGDQQRVWWEAEPQFNAQGVELSWMAPTPFYWQLQFSIYNEFSDRSPGSFYDQYLQGIDYRESGRGGDDFTYHWGTKTFFELSPDHSVRLFANALLDSPTSAARRTTESGGFSYLWHPLEGGLYKGLEWTTEVFANQERFFGSIPEQDSWGVYSYVAKRLGRRVEVGLLGEWSTFRFDDSAGAWHAGAWLTYRLSERQLFRFQIDRFGAQDWLDAISSRTRVRAGDGDNWRFSLQWSVVLGSHEHTYQ